MQHTRKAPNKTLMSGWSGVTASAPAATLSQRQQQANQWLETLHDPDLGPVGATLKAKILALNYPESHDPALAVLGCLQTDFYIQPTGITHEYFYRPQIFYGAQTLDDAENFQISRAHEYLHALQFLNAPVTLTAPHLPFCLCPEDTLRMHELMERDAYTKEMWIALLPHTADSTLYKALDDRYGNLRDGFEATRKIRGLQAALIESAAARDSTILNTPSPDGQDNLTNFVSDCHDTALANTQHYLTATQGMNLKTIIVRCEPDDLYLIGEAFGPNSLGMRTLDEQYTQPLSLSDKRRACLNTLNTQMGILDKNDLPTFKEALAAQGLTPENYSQRLHAQSPVTKNTPAAPRPA